MTPEAVAQALGAERVDELARLSAGASRETWSCIAEGRRVVVQRERPGGLERRGMEVESRLIGLAAAAGVPVPEVLASGGAGGPLEYPFLATQWLAGETIPRKLLRDDAYATARLRLAHQAGEALARIHAIPLDEMEGELAEDDALAGLAELLAGFEDPHPAFELGLRRLAAARPAAAGRGIVHGDFRTGNLLVDDHGLAAVLDWELAFIGDPAADLGWFCSRPWRFGSSHRAGGFGSLEDLLAGYVEAGGAPIDIETVRWWEALASIRWGVICMVQAATHLGHLSRSVELAAIGRRVAEAEWDLLEVLPVSAPYDRPTAAELVEAVREFLETEAGPALEGRLAFLSRVAVGALGIVQRELALGPEHAARHEARLAALGVDDDLQLVAAIRGGDFDDRWDELVAAVRESVHDKLAVAHPGYTDPA